MVSTKKVDNLSNANKRTLLWAKYWLNKYALRGIKQMAKKAGCPTGYRVRNGKCVPTIKEKIELKKDLNIILNKARINKNLRTAVLEARKAIDKDDIELAADLTAVKSYVTGEIDPKDKRNRFQEDDDYNQKVLGYSVYNNLDGLHHDLAWASGTIPSGMMIGTSGGMLHGRGKSRKKHPVIKMMEKEEKEIWERARREMKRDV